MSVIHDADATTRAMSSCDSWVILHFTPLQLVVGEMKVLPDEAIYADEPIIAPIAVLPAIVPDWMNVSTQCRPGQEMKSAQKIGSDCGAIVWLKSIIHEQAFEHLLHFVFDDVLYKTDRACSHVVFVWKDHIDNQTRLYIDHFITNICGFGESVILKESDCLLAYHTNVSHSQAAEHVPNDCRMDDEDDAVPSHTAGYFMVDSSSNFGYHTGSPSKQGVPRSPPETGTIVHISEDSMTTMAFAHNSVQGRVRTSQYGLKHIEYLFSQLPSAYNCNTEPAQLSATQEYSKRWLPEMVVAQDDKCLGEQLMILRKQPNNNKADGSHIKPRYGGDVLKWLSLAAGELLIDPHSITSFFSWSSPNSDAVKELLHHFYRKPSLVTMIKSVSHDTVAFDLADQLLKRIYLSGECPMISGLPQRIANTLQSIRSDEMAQSKAANKERKGSSLARSWHLSQLNITQLEEALMNVTIEVVSPVDTDDGRIAIWRGGCYVIRNMIRRR